MSLSLSTVAATYGKSASMSALRGVNQHPAGVTTLLTGNIGLYSFLNQYPVIQTYAGVVTTFAGLAGTFGATNGTGSTSRFREPDGMAIDSAGNIYVADRRNHMIRKITSGGVVTTLAGLADTSGSTDGTGNVARFNSPTGMAIDSAGNLYVSDTGNYTIRKITSEGAVTTLAGLAGTSGYFDGAGSAARFLEPRGIAVDSAGNLYVADRAGVHTIRKITSGGVVFTLAGSTGTSGYLDGTGTAARFAFPTGIAVDSAGNLYVSEAGNNTIRKITSEAAVTTLAGSAGNTGSTDGTGVAARFYEPCYMAIDSAGNLYVADKNNLMIRKITPAGVVTKLAGFLAVGSTDGTGSAARFNLPRGVAVDSTGNIYVTDTGNHTIRKIT